MRCLLITIQPREGGDGESREIDLPDYVQSAAVLEHCVAAIRELWGEEKASEIIESYNPG